MAASTSKNKSRLRIQGFPPVIGRKPLVLILGTMPGRMSLIKKEYYGHKQNQFWRIMFAVYGEEYSSAYADKIRFLKGRAIALWDVLDTCVRENTSADAAIKDGIPNDIPGLLAQYPSIQHLFFDGKTAEALFHKYFRDALTQKTHVLPSTSPANVNYTFRQKLVQWRKIRKVTE